MMAPIAEARSVMEGVGHTPAEAAIIADHLIDCELRGLQFGGLPYGTLKKIPLVRRDNARAASVASLNRCSWTR